MFTLVTPTKINDKYNSVLARMVQFIVIPNKNLNKLSLTEVLVVGLLVLYASVRGLSIHCRSFNGGRIISQPITSTN